MSPQAGTTTLHSPTYLPVESTTVRRPWIEHWLETCRDLTELKASHPMMDAVIDEIDGRMIRIGDHWLADFASCNYLGFDLDREIIEAVPAYLDAWGTHPSWSRLLGSPALYEQIEERLTELLGSEDTLVLPTITHIHMSVIPLLAGLGHDLPRRARAQDDLRRLPGRPRARRRGPAASASRTPTTSTSCCAPSATATRLVCMDGVNSMTGNAPDLPAFAARRAASTARCSTSTTRTASASSASARPDETSPVRHARQQRRPPRRRDLRQHRARRRLLEGVLVAAGVHRLPDRAQEPAEGRRAAVPLLRPVAGRLAGHGARRLRRQRAPRRRAARRRCTRKTRARARRARRASASHTPNRSGFPIIEIPLRRPRGASTRSASFLFDRGIYVTLAAYPLVPRDEVGFRVQVTAANTDAEVDMLDRGPRGARRARRAAACDAGVAARSERAADDDRRRAAARPRSSGRRYLAVGALAVRCSTSCVPPFAGSGPLMNLLGLSPVVAIVVGVRMHRPASRGAVVVVRRRLRPVLARRPLHLQLPAPVRRRGAVPVASATRVRRVYPALMAGLLMLVRAPQPGARPRGAHRLADHDDRPVAARRGSC